MKGLIACKGNFICWPDSKPQSTGNGDARQIPKVEDGRARLLQLRKILEKDSSCPGRGRWLGWIDRREEKKKYATSLHRQDLRLRARTSRRKNQIWGQTRPAGTRTPRGEAKQSERDLEVGGGLQAKPARHDPYTKRELNPAPI